MSAPKRIQRRRTKGWRMPEGAVYVGRPSRWGNPWRVGDGIDQPFVWDLPSWSEVDTRDGTTTITPALAVDMFRRMFGQFSARYQAIEVEQLRGKNLVCWCPGPCGEDVDLGWGEFGGPYEPCAKPRGHNGSHDPSVAPWCHADVLLELANRAEAAA